MKADPAEFRIRRDECIVSGSVVGFKKYKAMYQFDARNADELSLKVGDIVHVSGHAIFHHFFLV